MTNDLVVHQKPKAAVSEAIRTIRTNLQFSSIDEKVKSILITSSSPSEGKSFICANLAIAFAQAGNKVLIVDCDMRRGRQHRIFRISNEIGLSNLLIDDVVKKYENYIFKTNVPNVFVLPSGVVPPNPTELLSSSKNRELASILEEKYDMVIYDGVPVGGLADAIIMADIVDKICIVSAYKQTKMEDLLNTKKGLEKFQNKIAGVIINKIPGEHNSYYGYYEEN